MNRKGALIEKGPVDWQIFQQIEGKADISLEGSWSPVEEMKNPTVFAKVVREDDGAIVCWWVPAAMRKEKWSVVLKGVPAGGLYRLETCLGEKNTVNIEMVVRGDMVHHLGVGDLYVIAGQSNSAGYGKDPIYDAPEIGIHLLKNSGCWDLATHPMNDTTNTIQSANYESHNSGTSPFLSFGKYLKRELNYPIGLLQTSLGGSRLKEWDPYEEASLHNNMLDVIRSQGGKIKGILWYQGCADAWDGRSEAYLERFERVVLAVRNELKEDVPYLTVQLNRLTGQYPLIETDIRIHDREWGRVREDQRQAARQIPKVWVVPSTDCTLSDDIHNSSASNLVLGERIAVSALRHIYGKAAGYDAPDLEKAVQIGKNCLRLEFAHVKNSLFTFSAPVEDLAISVLDGAGEQIKIVGYSLDGNKINITLEKELTNECVVCGASERNPSRGIPIDTASHIPMLSFYAVSIESASTGQNCDTFF